MRIRLGGVGATYGGNSSSMQFSGRARVGTNGILQCNLMWALGFLGRDLVCHSVHVHLQ